MGKIVIRDLGEMLVASRGRSGEFGTDYLSKKSVSSYISPYM